MDLMDKMSKLYLSFRQSYFREKSNFFDKCGTYQYLLDETNPNLLEF